MIRKQKQTVESFVRVRAFVDAHPVGAPHSYAGDPQTLDEVVRLFREYAGTQVTARERGRGATRRQSQLVRQLIGGHVRPLVAIANTQNEAGHDVRMPISIRMPQDGIGVTRVLQACDGIIEAVRPFEAAFVAAGRPADFLARYAALRAELAAMVGGRAAHVASHVAARAGLAVQLRRGRNAVRRLDAVVRAAFDEDPMTLAAWRVASRVQLRVGRPAARGAEEEQPALPQDLERAA